MACAYLPFCIYTYIFLYKDSSMFPNSQIKMSIRLYVAAATRRRRPCCAYRSIIGVSGCWMTTCVCMKQTRRGEEEEEARREWRSFFYFTLTKAHHMEDSSVVFSPSPLCVKRSFLPVTQKASELRLLFLYGGAGDCFFLSLLLSSSFLPASLPSLRHSGVSSAFIEIQDTPDVWKYLYQVVYVKARLQRCKGRKCRSELFSLSLGAWMCLSLSIDSRESESSLFTRACGRLLVFRGCRMLASVCVSSCSILSSHSDLSRSISLRGSFTRCLGSCCGVFVLLSDSGSLRR